MAPQPTYPPHNRVYLLALILLVGFWLRLVLHDYHGIEGDDGFSLSLTGIETGDLIRGLATLELDIHPPLHFLALKYWIKLAGDSLLALRLMNMLADLLTGSLMLRIAGRVAGHRVAVLAGALWLIAPLLLYSTLLIRMYTLLAMFATAGAACVVEAKYLRRAGIGYAGAALFSLLAAGMHLVGALIAGALALTMVIDWAIRPGRRLTALVIGAAAFVIAGVVYWPYLSAVWAVHRSGRSLGAEISETSFADPLSTLFDALATILTHRALSGGAAVALITLLLAVGCVGLWRRYRLRVLSLLLILWSGLAGMALLGWAAGFYKARYLNPFVPFVLVVIACCVMLLNARMRFAASTGILALMGWALLQDFDRTFRDDWAAAAAFIEQHERTGDRVIVIPDWGQHAFNFHYRGEATVVGLFPQVSTNVDYAAILAEQTAEFDRVWFVHYQPEISDPTRLADLWFRTQASLMTEIFPAGMHIRYYDFAPVMHILPLDVRPLDARFGDHIDLLGVHIPVNRGSARDERLHPPSNWVQVILYWEALEPNLPVMPRVRLTDPYAQVYGATLERDGDAVDRYPVATWQPGEIWQVVYDLNLNPQTPPGTYNIEVMVLDAAGQPLPTSGADAGEFWVIAGQFVVE